MAFIRADIENVEEYSRAYGPAYKRWAVRAASEVLTREVRILGGPRATVGLVGGEEFRITCPADRAAYIAVETARRFDELMPYLYDDGERAALPRMRLKVALEQGAAIID